MLSLGQYYFLIENATLEDDAWYEIQIPKYSLQSKPAKLTVQGKFKTQNLCECFI